MYLCRPKLSPCALLSPHVATCQPMIFLHSHRVNQLQQPEMIMTGKTLCLLCTEVNRCSCNNLAHVMCIAELSQRQAKGRSQQLLLHNPDQSKTSACQVITWVQHPHTQTVPESMRFGVQHALWAAAVDWYTRPHTCVLGCSSCSCCELLDQAALRHYKVSSYSMSLLCYRCTKRLSLNGSQSADPKARVQRCQQTTQVLYA
jgi:hypothetical protein